MKYTGLYEKDFDIIITSIVGIKELFDPFTQNLLRSECTEIARHMKSN